MDLINCGDLEVGRPGWPWFLYYLRVVALVFGYTLAGAGWLVFLMLLFLLGTGFDEFDHGDAEFLRFIGAPVTSGWLLLRFAGGLFPFSRCFFPWQKRRG